MAGKGVRVLVTPTADLGKILSSMHGTPLTPACLLGHWKARKQGVPPGAQFRDNCARAAWSSSASSLSIGAMALQSVLCVSWSLGGDVGFIREAFEMTIVRAGVEIGGQSNVLSAVQVAQLALKHRQNKNQRQRIVLFSGRSVPARSLQAPVRTLFGYVTAPELGCLQLSEALDV